ncbi:MAG: GHKL domain-containing protein [Eubacterium sp.]|nr:GHKL domain-containing protein [Eubacterium sp.]
MSMIIFLISSAFQTYEVYLLMQCFLKKCRFGGKGVLCAYAGLYLMLTLPNLILGIPVVNLICSFGGELLITMLYKERWKKRILSGVFLFVIFTLTECVVALLSGYIDLDLFSSSEYFSVFGTISLPVVMFLIVLFIRNLKNIQEGEDVPASYWIISVALPISSVYLFLLFYQQPGLKLQSVAACAVVLFAVNIFVIYLYDRQIHSFRLQVEKDTLELQNQYQRKQLELMNELVEQVREQRHDFIKHISMISYMNDQHETERLAAYLGEIQENILQNQKYADTGNPVLDGILNYKLQEAVAADISVDMELKVPEELELSVYDMNLILANLMDNSMEAVRDIRQKKITLGVRYSSKGERLFIWIRNPYEGEREKREGNFCTTKEDKAYHGYGLRKVGKIVKKYDGTLEISTKNKIFEIKICLFL